MARRSTSSEELPCTRPAFECDRLPSAIQVPVVWWNASHVCVKCSFCDKLHRHRFPPGCHQGIPSSIQWNPPCVPGASYEFAFPVDVKNGLVGYEIDKQRTRFVNVRYQTGEEEEEEEEEDVFTGLAGMFETKMAISTHIIEISEQEPHSCGGEDVKQVKTYRKPPSEAETKAHRKAVSQCREGDVRAVEEYLKNTPYKDFFLHGETPMGDTSLIVAAKRKSPKVVRLLLLEGADPNSVNSKGRSALMEAALWGRLENVKVLLQHDARKDLRDHEGKSAMDLAQPRMANERERWNRFPSAAADGQRAYDADRQLIILLLNEMIAQQHGYTGPLPEHERHKYWFTANKRTHRITLEGPKPSLFSVSQTWKTVAVLDRGDPFDRISAISGWGGDTQPRNMTTGQDWDVDAVDEALILAHTIGYRLPSTGFDQQDRGRYYACHAEKKLIAYFIAKHVFVPRNFMHPRNLANSIEKLETRIRNDNFQCETRKMYWNLMNEKSKLIWEVLQGKGLSNRQVSGEEISDEESQEFDEEGVNDEESDEDSVEKQLDDLKRKIFTLEAEIAQLESHVEVKQMQEQQMRLKVLKAKQKQPTALKKLSMRFPAKSKKNAVILCSKLPCEDCKAFTVRVNETWGLNIELSFNGER